MGTVHGWLIAVLILLLAGTALAAVRWRRALRVEVAENARWRTLAGERADRVSMLSHEVRTPLVLISGAAELLEDQTAGPLTERQLALVSSIVVNARQMTSLAEDLLTDARIEAGIFRIDAQPTNLRTVIRKVVADGRTLYPNRIVMDVPGVPPKVIGDPQLMHQALANLLSNAARHAGRDARIIVGARYVEDGVLLTVSDNGSGMTPQQRRALFTRTMEGKSVTGNGLGLLITKKIVELHGGRCLVDTEELRGTTMIISLPSHARRIT